ncbi:MAG TPA: C25 family cysteine peptidase, partial [Blastocatellia bacterium]|nr:C25 family cysteine peptidase [Blastocatellia bacterium]
MIDVIYNRALRTRVTAVFCFISLAVLLATGLSVASSSPDARTAVTPVSVNGSSAESLRNSLDQMMGQMAALKREIGRDGETPELMSRYDILANRIHAAARQSQSDYASAAVQPLSPNANNVCISNSLAATDDTFQRPNPQGTPQPVCPTAFTAPTCPGTTPIVRFDNYGFNLTGCTFPTCVTISMCGVAPCAGDITQNIDTLIYVYRTGGATPGTGAVNPFNKGAPCTNLLGGNDDGAGCGAGADALRSSCTINLGTGHFVVVVCAFSATLQNTGNYHLLVSAPAAGCTVTAEPTAVDLDTFKATGYDDGTLLEWRTGLEVKNLGFNVYREAGDKRTRLNNQVLGGSALLVGPSTNLRSGNSYAWTDTSPAGKKTRYWLEDLGLDGQSTWHGPFNVDRSAPGNRLLPSKGRAQLLSKLGTDASQAGQTVALPRAANSPEMMVAGLLGGQSDLAKLPAMKLSIKQEGWYRVSQSELAAAGFDTKTDPRMLQMFVDGQEQPISVSGQEDGRFDSSDAVEFYGVGPDSAYTDSRTYWLVSGSQPGLRIEKVKSKGTSAASRSFPYTVERRDRSIYFSALRNGDKENFFGAVIARDAVDQSISVQHLDVAGSGAELELALQGVTELPHRVRVELNGVEVGYTGFDGQTEGTTRIPLGRGVLKEGQNIVRLTALGDESDVSLVDFIRVTYPHTYTADSDALRFTAQAGRQLSIGGFTSPGVRVFDVTDPGAVSEVAALAQLQKSGYLVTVTAGDGRGDRLLLALTNGRVSRPAAMSPNRPSTLRWPGQGADLIVISHRDYLDAVGPLKAVRESQGLSVAVVDVEDVYDEFSFGQKSPQAIRDFLAFASTGWQRPPRFVLLVGEGSLDPKGYLGFADSDFVPTKLIDTRLMETASDDWFADFDGNGVAEMAIGRLPVRSAPEAATVIAKIIGYDRSQSSNSVLLVADSNDGYDFGSMSSGLRDAIPQSMKVSEIHRGETDPASAQSELIAALGQGQKIVNYVGHGNVDQWRASLLTSGSARTLTNSQLPLFVMMTCLNGYFQDPVLESLAGSLMKAERGGAVAVWASSGMTTPADQSVLNQQMFRLVLDSANAGSLTLGEATVKAKSAV